MGAKNKGRLFIISAPSGCGKTTLCKKLLDDDLCLSQSISVTTRAPRKDEAEGKDYFFVSPEKFQAMVKRGELLEHEENFGAMYGTPKKFVLGLLKKNKSVLLSIDVKGAMKVRRALPEESRLIFIMPPTLAALRKRLESRQTEHADSISHRLKVARREIEYKDRYDYVVVNDSIDAAYAELKNIIIKETQKGDQICRTRR